MQTTDTRLTADRYYEAPDVRRRILEYCGEDTDSRAVYVAAFEPDASGHHTWNPTSTYPLERLPELWRRGRDLARSMWDTGALLFFFELDYLNVDRPDEAFLHRADVFFKLEPAYRSAVGALRSLSITPWVQMTGRGYHFVGRIPLEAPVIDRLAAIVPGVPAWHATLATRHDPLPAVMSERQARAAVGLGCLVEYAAHLVRSHTSGSPIPVVFNGTIVGAGIVGREAVSVDFSYVGDPLDVRYVRTAFSTYQLHRLRVDLFGSAAASTTLLAALPRARAALYPVLARGRTLEEARLVAGQTHATIPDVSEGISHLLTAYEQSPLSEFHREFYASLAAAPRRPEFDPSGVPPCVSAPLTYPNDLLLKPEHVQHVVRGLMARGWPPAVIARLVQDRYEADHGWGQRWTRLMDRQTRAEFDVRVFAGLLATSADALIDFNCVSAQEKGICPRTGCPHDLREDRDRILTKPR